VRVCFGVVLCVIVMGPNDYAMGATRVQLAGGAKASIPVVHAKDATNRVRNAAADLATYLGRMSGAEFVTRAGDGTSGIAVGLAADFPLLGLGQTLEVTKIADREAYILRSHKDGLYVIGATEQAVEHAVWDVLGRLGYRQFFPGRTWEVIPHKQTLEIAIDATERPDYLNRRIWYGFGTWDYNARPYAQWCQRNRTASGFVLNISHAYESVIRRNKASFDQHPEFLGLLNGERKSSKLCIGNPDLRELVAKHAIRYFEDAPDRDSISMDPSDGGDWCECDRCAALGSVSDRALTLANQVAQAVESKFKNKYVGMYAYNYHSPPPSIRVHPNVIISIATAFIKGGYSLDELIAGWSKQGATIGMREYYAVFPWDHDLPGRSRGSDLEYLQRTIPEFHAKGARFMSAESSDNWGPNGLGYYVASRILWDLDEAENVDRIVEDFLTKAFGPAKEPMRRFYQLINGSGRPPLCDDLIGRMFRQLQKARQLAQTPQIRERINHLVLYTRYVELYHEYSNSDGPQRQAAFETLVRHGYRMHETMMVHTKAIYRDLVNRDKKVNIPENASWSVPQEKNPWKSGEPYAKPELADYLRRGIAEHPLRDFEPVRYSKDFAPATKLQLPEVATGFAGVTGRGIQTFYTWITKAPALIELKITGGLIAHYRNRGNAKVDLWKIRKESDAARNKASVSHGESVPDGVERVITLRAQQVGLHKITVSDGDDMTKVAWKPGTPMTIISSLDEPASFSGSWNMYFYVPKQTEIVGLYANGSGTLLDADGNVAFVFKGGKANFYAIEVPEGLDGKLWKFHQSTGTRRLMTVPPCLARSADELLLPKEVVEADCIPMQMAKANWRVWTATSTRRVLRDEPAGAATSARISAARNEWESFQVLVRSDVAVKGVGLAPGDLKGPEGVVLRAEDARLYRQHQLELTAGTHRNDRFKPGWYPDPLIPFRHPLTREPLGQARFTAAALDLPAEQTHGFWVDIYVPTEARPGEYHGTYRVTAEDGRAVDIPVTLTVWDFALPRVSTLQTALGSPAGRMRGYYRQRAKEGKDKEPSDWEIVEAQCAEMLTRHRINATPPQGSLTPVAQPDGSYRIRPEQIRKLREFVDRYHVNAIQVPRPTSIVKDPDEQRDKLRAWLKSWDDAAEKLNRPNVTFYIYLKDEPNDEEAYKFVQTWGRAIRRAKSVVKVMVVEQTWTEKGKSGANSEWGQLHGAVDIWCPLFCLFRPENAAERQALGETVWTYTALCQGKSPSPWWHIDYPLLNYRVPAWISWRHRIRGLLYWGGMSYWRQAQGPWTDPWTYGKPDRVYNGEGTIVYPGRAAGYEGIAPSLRLKALRDSIEDYEYLSILERSGLADEAQKVVMPLAGSWFNWEADPAEYEKARAKLAKMILDAGN